MTFARSAAVRMAVPSMLMLDSAIPATSKATTMSTGPAGGRGNTHAQARQPPGAPPAPPVLMNGSMGTPCSFLAVADGRSGCSGSPVSKPDLDAWPTIRAERTEHADHVTHFRGSPQQQVDHESVRIHLEAIDGDRDHIVLKHEGIDREHRGNGAL